MTARFLDTNVLLRYLTRDDEQKARQALELLLRTARGDEELETSPMVIFETIFTLHRQYHESRERIRALLQPIISLPSLHLSERATYLRALDIFATVNISFADAFNAAQMEAHRLTEIYSWDSDFDKLVGITRIEPGEARSSQG